MIDDRVNGVLLRCFANTQSNHVPFDGEGSGEGWDFVHHLLFFTHLTILRNAHEFPRSHQEEVYFYLRHKKIEQADLDQIFSESKY